jgi:hypothetical protein
MAGAVRITGIGVVRAPAAAPQATEERARRLRGVLAALAPDRGPIRLAHVIEEVAILAAYEVLSRSGVPLPYRGEDIGVTLGVEEGIDGIKARYYAGILRDGPLGASLLAFPLTTPNTIAARISILLDMRGECLTVCGGSLSGAHAIGLAVQAIRAGRYARVLAGGVTSIEAEFLDAVARLVPSTGRPLETAAGLLLLESRGGAKGTDGRELLGFGEGFGARDAEDAIGACLEDAKTLPQAIGSVRVAAIHEWRSMVESVREAGLVAPIVLSPSSNLESASFPLAVAEVSREAGVGSSAPVLVLGRDCLAGAAATIVRGEG